MEERCLEFCVTNIISHGSEAYKKFRADLQVTVEKPYGCIGACATCVEVPMALYSGPGSLKIITADDTSSLISLIKEELKKINSI